MHFQWMWSTFRTMFWLVERKLIPLNCNPQNWQLMHQSVHCNWQAAYLQLRSWQMEIQMEYQNPKTRIVKTQSKIGYCKNEIYNRYVKFVSWIYLIIYNHTDYIWEKWPEEPMNNIIRKITQKCTDVHNREKYMAMAYTSYTEWHIYRHIYVMSLYVTFMRFIIHAYSYS